jgi:rhodanese-related sulfurtransferase
MMCVLITIAFLAVPLVQMAASAPASTESSANIPQLSPEELVKILRGGGEKPLIFQVGFRVLYVQAHIPGSEYAGPGSDEVGLQLLWKRVASLPKNRFIVLYCGCCPWAHCPNVKPAYDELHARGFTNVKVLHIADNFGTNWVDKGYPVAKGQ